MVQFCVDVPISGTDRVITKIFQHPDRPYKGEHFLISKHWGEFCLVEGVFHRPQEFPGIWVLVDGSDIDQATAELLIKEEGWKYQ